MSVFGNIRIILAVYGQDIKKSAWFRSLEENEAVFSFWEEIKYSGLRNAWTPIIDPPLGWPWAFATPPPLTSK